MTVLRNKVIFSKKKKKKLKNRHPRLSLRIKMGRAFHRIVFLWNSLYQILWLWNWSLYFCKGIKITNAGYAAWLLSLLPSSNVQGPPWVDPWLLSWADKLSLTLMLSDIKLWSSAKNNSSMSEVRQMGLPRWLSGKETACQGSRCRRHEFGSWVGKIPWRRKWQPTPVFLLGESHGQRSLAGSSLWGHKGLDRIEHGHMLLTTYMPGVTYINNLHILPWGRTIMNPIPWSTEMLHNLHLISNRARVWLQVIWPQGPSS